MKYLVLQNDSCKSGNDCFITNDKRKRLKIRNETIETKARSQAN